MRNPSVELDNANKAIEHSIETLAFQGRGPVARDVVGNLRHLVEHVAMLAIYGGDYEEDDYFKSINKALKRLQKRRETRFISDFHELLQKVDSHYVPTEDAAERLFLKYYENLLLLRRYGADVLGVRILGNLEKIPLDVDPGLTEYYESIARKVDQFMFAYSPNLSSERFYVRSVKPFFVGGSVYYESTLIPAFNFSSKFDHILVFSAFRIQTNYSIRVSTKATSVKGLGSSLPITIVDDYEVAVRPCELNALLRILGKPKIATLTGQYGSYKSLMRFMSCTGMNLCEIAQLPDASFCKVMDEIEYTGAKCSVHELLCLSHEFLRRGGDGENVLKYLLSRPRDRVLKEQEASDPNPKLGKLYLKYGCIPFDRQPYCTSLIGHEVAPEELYQCIDPKIYEDNFIPRFVSKKTCDSGSLYVADDLFANFINIDDLIFQYNSRLYWKHAPRRLIHEMGQVFVRGDEDDATVILQGLLKLSGAGLGGYVSTCEEWLDKNPGVIDDHAKVDALRTLFADTKVALVYGSAGTGKTTMVNIACSVMRDADKIAIANTNPAVDSLRRKINDSHCEFETIAKYINDPIDCDILIVDECSTVSNQDMRKIIGLGKFELLMLVGDVRQIESVKLGNWFTLAKQFLPVRCIHEFETPWRATNKDLSKLWASVRKMNGDIEEILTSCYMASNLSEAILTRTSEDEIVLCLNYDGLYGINNMNKLLQGANPNPEHKWNLHIYKVGDPILFNESNRFYPLLYNNLKGRIEDIDDSRSDRIVFTVSVDVTLTEISTCRYEGLELLGHEKGRSALRFSVKQIVNNDEEDLNDECVVPFQVAYAASVHKAQGLEYSSVKLVITKDAEKRITHNVFYTAITRARESLHIYWSPESQSRILSSFELSSCNKDAQLLSKRRGLKLNH